MKAEPLGTKSHTRVRTVLSVALIVSGIFLTSSAICLSYWDGRMGLTTISQRFTGSTPTAVSQPPTVTPLTTPSPSATRGQPIIPPSLTLPAPGGQPAVAPPPSPSATGTPAPTATVTPTVVPTLAAQATPTPSATSTLSGEAADPPPTSIVHTVQAGESLWLIARTHGTTVDRLARANQIANPSRIKIGQKLIVPSGTEIALPTVPTATRIPVSTPRVLPAPTVVSLLATSQPMPIRAAGAPTRIVVPKIKLDAKVVEVGWQVVEENGQKFKRWDVADFAAGWQRGSGFPGQASNTVISGHHNIKGEVFRYLVQLEAGDEVDVYVGDQPHRYAVTEKHILPEKGMPVEVRDANLRWAEPTPDERLTLITCWPYTNNTHRLIVVAKPMGK